MGLSNDNSLRVRGRESFSAIGARRIDPLGVDLALELLGFGPHQFDDTIPAFSVNRAPGTKIETRHISVLAVWNGRKSEADRPPRCDRMSGRDSSRAGTTSRHDGLHRRSQHTQHHRWRRRYRGRSHVNCGRHAVGQSDPASAGICSVRALARAPAVQMTVLLSMRSPVEDVRPSASISVTAAPTRHDHAEIPKCLRDHGARSGTEIRADIVGLFDDNHVDVRVDRPAPRADARAFRRRSRCR